MIGDPLYPQTTTPITTPMPLSPGDGPETKQVVPCSQCKYDNKCMLQSFVESEGVKPFDRETWFCPDGKKRGDAE